MINFGPDLQQVCNQQSHSWFNSSCRFGPFCFIGQTWLEAGIFLVYAQCKMEASLNKSQNVHVRFISYSQLMSFGNCYGIRLDFPVLHPVLLLIPSSCWFPALLRENSHDKLSGLPARNPDRSDYRQILWSCWFPKFKPLVCQTLGRIHPSCPSYGKIPGNNSSAFLERAAHSGAGLGGQRCQIFICRGYCARINVSKCIQSGC